MTPDQAPIRDPVRHAAEIITGTPSSSDTTRLEERLKRDIIASIGRIKPALTSELDFDKDVMSGGFFESLSPALQGIAITRVEGALAFYNRVGWNPAFMGQSVEVCIRDEQPRLLLKERCHVNDLHDLAYLHPKHLVKVLGKETAAATWDSLKNLSDTLGAAR